MQSIRCKGSNVHAEAFYKYSKNIYFKSWNKLVFAIRFAVIYFKIQNGKWSLMVNKNDKLSPSSSVFFYSSVKQA